MQRREYAYLQKRKTVTLHSGRLMTIYHGLCKKGLATAGKNENEFVLIAMEDMSQESLALLERHRIDAVESAPPKIKRPPAVYSNVSRTEIIDRVLQTR